MASSLWLLRLGYYKLTRPKIQANDWVWIVDHTIQLGCEKGFVILGIRLCNLPPAGNCLKHEDVEAITLSPVTQSNGEVVTELLEKSIAKTGVPRMIVGDYGSSFQRVFLGFVKLIKKRVIFMISNIKQPLFSKENYRLRKLGENLPV